MMDACSENCFGFCAVWLSKFKEFQAPALFSSTFKALNLGEIKSSTFKDYQGCVGTLFQ